MGSLAAKSGQFRVKACGMALGRLGLALETPHGIVGCGACESAQREEKCTICRDMHIEIRETVQQDSRTAEYSGQGNASWDLQNAVYSDAIEKNEETDDCAKAE